MPSLIQRIACSFLAVVSVLAASAPACPPYPELSRPVPADTLIKDLDAYVADNPSDGVGWWRLGAAHDLIYSRKLRFITVYVVGDAKLAIPARDFEQDFRQFEDGHIPYEPAQLHRHLAEAIRCLNKAVELEPNSARIHSQFARLLERASADAAHSGVVALPNPARESPEWTKLAGDAVLHFLRLSNKDELATGPRLDTFNLTWESLLSERQTRTAFLTGLLEATDRTPPQLRDIGRVVRRDWLALRCELHFKAFSLSLARVSDRARIPFEVGDFRLESARAFLAAVEVNGGNAGDSTRVAIARAAVEALERDHESTRAMYGRYTPAVD